MKAVALAALLYPVVSLAAEQPRDFAYGVPIQIEGHEALYEVDIPAALYRGVMRRDLGDVRVFNAEGELVPFATEPARERASQRPDPVAVPFFPVYGGQSLPLEAVQLRVDKASGATVVNVTADPHKPMGKRRLLAYLIDAGATARPYELLQLDWRQQTSSFAINVRLDASDDLKSWSTVVARAPLMRVDYAGQRLEQRTIEFAPRTSKYLRLSVSDARSDLDTQTDAQLELTAASLRAGGIALETPRNWMEVHASAGDNAGEYRFDFGGPYPVDRVRIGLIQDNAIATAELLVRPTSADPWRSLASTVVYRLTRDGHQVVSPELAVSAHSERYWLLRVDQRGGGLGTGMPILYAGWVPQRIVFAARGNARAPHPPPMPSRPSCRAGVMMHDHSCRRRRHCLSACSGDRRRCNVRASARSGRCGSRCWSGLQCWAGWPGGSPGSCRHPLQRRGPGNEEGSAWILSTVQGHVPTPVEGRGQRVPGKRCAVAARGEIAHYAQHCQLIHVVDRLWSVFVGEQTDEMLIERARPRDRLSTHGFGHHRCGCHGDAAARALECRFANHLAVQVHIHREAIATQRVHALRLSICALDRPEVAGVLDVIEDHLVVQCAAL